MTALLEVADLRAGYGEIAVLHGIDFRLEEGSVTTLLGANGAGKTTTLRAICGMLGGMLPVTSEIRFAGEPIAGWATEDIVRLGIAHVPEGRGTFLRETVEENLQLGAMTRRRPRRRRETWRAFYGTFPVLQERRHQQAGTLSGGEQQSSRSAGR
jgi:branched-chain amino acid transport system ATP-binding protein